MAVVKADGYGHGAITVARAAIAAGAEWLGATGRRLRLTKTGVRDRVALVVLAYECGAVGAD